jgi:parvulin-like peptidyl-prolyl isomerase
MLITKFNKLIHNKIIWAAFAILISLAMVGMFAPSSGRKNNSKDRNSAGKLFGEPVSRTEFGMAELFNRKFQPKSITDEEQKKLLDEETWQRLAILRLAKQMNVTVSNQELNEIIQRDPAFSVNGIFNGQRYRQLIEEQMRIRVPVYEEYIRQEITLRKMSSIVGQSIWVSPFETERSVARLTDTFTVQVVDLPYSNSVADIEASPEDVQNFYNEHTNTFETAEMRSVKYVQWSVSNYLDKVSVSEGEIQDYYDDNLEKNYASTDTNGTKTYKPLEDVTGEIKSYLAHHKASGLASEEAMVFSDKILDIIDAGKETASIETVASKRKCTVNTTKFFSAAGDVPGLDVDEKFNTAAFRLSPDDPEDQFSQAVITENAVFVMAIDKIKPPMIPAFKDIKDEVKKYADSLAKSTAFKEKAESIRNQLVVAAPGEKGIIKYAKKIGLKGKSPKPFSLYEASVNRDEELSEIAPAILSLDKGEVSEPVPTAEGVSFVYVVDRQPGDLALAESLKPDIAGRIQSNRMQAQFITWAKTVLDEARAAN